MTIMMMDTTTDSDCCCSSTLPTTMDVMLRQEAKNYDCRDYLYQDLPSSGCNKPLNSIEEDRAKMVQWCYQVADFCRMNRETVEIAISYFDRYLAVQCTSGNDADIFINTDMFQLAAMTCLYTAAKINEFESFEPWMLSKMSRGLYTTTQLENMELEIIQALQWHMNPPTIMSFVREFLDSISSTLLDEASRTTVYELCKLQAELCLRRYEFVPVKASAIAYASIKNSMESVGVDSAIVDALLSQTFDCYVDESAKQGLVSVQHRLCEAVTEFSEVESALTTRSSTPTKAVAVSSASTSTTVRSSSPCTVQTPSAYAM